jgi:hypothetical protein
LFSVDFGEVNGIIGVSLAGMARGEESG